MPRGLKQLRGLSYFSTAWRALREMGLEKSIKEDKLPKTEGGLKILNISWSNLKKWCDRIETILIRLASLECFLDGKGEPYSAEEIEQLILPGYDMSMDYYVPSRERVSGFETWAKTGGLAKLCAKMGFVPAVLTDQRMTVKAPKWLNKKRVLQSR